MCVLISHHGWFKNYCCIYHISRSHVTSVLTLTVITYMYFLLVAMNYHQNHVFFRLVIPFRVIFQCSGLATLPSVGAVIPYYCRLGDLLCYTCMLYLSTIMSVYACVYFVFSLFYGLFSFVGFTSVLWYCWLGLLTCKNRLPYNLYCVGGDVKHYSTNQSISDLNHAFIFLPLFAGRSWKMPILLNYWIF